MATGEFKRIRSERLATYNDGWGLNRRGTEDAEARKGALTLDECLHQQFRGDKRSLKSLTRRFQKRLAQVNATPWLMATGEDLLWPTTVGGQPDRMSRLMHRYLDGVLLSSLDHPETYRTFGEVVHMLKPPTALFQPGILAQVLRQAIGRIF